MNGFVFWWIPPFERLYFNCDFFTTTTIGETKMYTILWQYFSDINLLIHNPQEKSFNTKKEADSYYNLLANNLDVFGLRKLY